MTLSGLLRRSPRARPGPALIEGMVTDGYLPAPADASNTWIALFKQVHDKYDQSAPMDGNVEYGMASAYTFVRR